MKYTILATGLLIFIFSACEKQIQIPETTCVEREYCSASDQLEDLCQVDSCINYLQIWKELFIEKNNLTEAFFDAHIKVNKTGLNTWRRGTNFGVSFVVNLDWLTFCSWDKFIIHITDEDGLYPSLDLPRNTLLSKDQIKIASDNFAFASKIRSMNILEDLQFESREAAMEDLLSFSGVSDLCFNSYKLNRNTGNLYLLALAEYVGGDNECVQGTIDLFTGEKEVMDTPCGIIN
jgi:hypothetical protein